MNQSINADSKNSKEPQQKYRLGTVSIKILGGLNRFYRRLTSPSASIMAQNIQLFGPRGGLLTHQWILRVLCMFFRHGIARNQYVQPTGSVRLACGQRRAPCRYYGLGNTCRSCGQCMGLRRCHRDLVIPIRSDLTGPAECKYGLYMTCQT